MMKNRLCGRRPAHLTQFIFRRQIGLCGTDGISTSDISMQLAEEKATLPIKNQSCELSGQSRSTFLIAFSPDGKKIASTHGDHTVRVTTIKTGQCTHILAGHPRTPWCLAFHPSSNEILASGCLGGEVRIWDLRGGGSEVWKSDKGFVIASITFHPVEHVLVIATTNELLFWDWTRPEPFARCKTAFEYERVRWVKFDPWGHRLYTGIANSSTIHQEEVSRENVGHSTADPSTQDERRRLRQRYRNIVQQITSHQPERILGNNRDSTGSSFLASSSSSHGETYSGPHHADLDIVEPRSPTHTDALESALAYSSDVTSRSHTALSRARQYAASVTSASLLGAGEHEERAVVRVRNEHAVLNEDGSNGEVGGEAASNPESPNISRSSIWSNSDNNNRDNSVANTQSLHTLSSPSFSGTPGSNHTPGSPQASGVTLPVSLGLTRILPPPVGSQEASSGVPYFADSTEILEDTPLGHSRPPLLPTERVESRTINDVPSVPSIMLPPLLNLESGASFDPSSLTNMPSTDIPASTSRSGTLPNPYRLTLPSPFAFEPDQMTDSSHLDFLGSMSNISSLSSLNSTRILPGMPLGGATPFSPVPLPDPRPAMPSSHASTSGQSLPPLTGHGASGLTLLANAGLALERQEQVERGSISLTSDGMHMPFTSTPLLTSSSTRPLQSMPLELSQVTSQSAPSATSSSSSVVDPVYITTTSAPVTTSLHNIHSGSHSPRPSLLRSQLELLQAEAPQVSEGGPVADNGLESGEMLNGVDSVPLTHSEEPAQSGTQQVEQPRRLASLIESEVRLAIERVRARQVDIRETLNALDQLQADVSDSVSSTDSTPRTTTLPSSNAPDDSVVQPINVNSSPPVPNNTSAEGSYQSTVSPDVSVESSDVPSSVVALSAELSRRLEHLNQLDERVNQITARLGDRMRSLAADRQRDLQRLQSSRHSSAARHRSAASERMLQRQERLRAHLNDIRRRYLTARERDAATDQLRRPVRDSNTRDTNDAFYPSNIGLPEETENRFPLSDAESDFRGPNEDNASSISSRPDRYGPLDARYMRRRHRQLHQEIQNMRAELASRRRQQREHERTWHTLQRRHLHPHYAVSILDDTINRQNDGLQAAINRAIAGVFMGSGETAVANNIVNLTHRIQHWDFRQSNIPDISQSDVGIVVPHCKLHNDASCEISADGQLLMTFVPSHRGFPDDTILGVFSLRPESFGQCLYTKSFGPNAISVSLSPLGCYVLVGLAAKRLAWVFTPKQMVAQVFQLKTPCAGEDSMEHICDLMHPCEMDYRSHVSVNSARWLPGVGQGVVYGTNRGDLHICRPGDEDHEPRDRANRGSGAPGGDSNPTWHQRRNLMQLLGLTVPRTASTSTQTTQRIRRTASTQTDRAAFE